MPDSVVSITINGATLATTIIQAGTTTANGVDRVFDIRNGADASLDGMAIDTLILTGAWTNFSVESTARYATDIARGVLPGPFDEVDARLLEERGELGQDGHDGAGILHEARTFGLDALFSSHKIYNPAGQRYTSVDRELMLAYKESTSGQIIHVGINEVFAREDWNAPVAYLAAAIDALQALLKDRDQVDDFCRGTSRKASSAARFRPHFRAFRAAPCRRRSSTRWPRATTAAGSPVYSQSQGNWFKRGWSWISRPI